MRYFFTLIFSFQLIFCQELTGIKFEVNEEMAQAVLYHFSSNIARFLSNIKLDDIHVTSGVNIRDIKGNVPFSSDMVKFSFRENGVNINISGLKAHISLTVCVSNVLISPFPFDKDVTIDIDSFSLDANIKVTSKYVDGRYIPDAEFIETPRHTMRLDVNIKGFFFFLNGGIESIAEGLLKDKIDDFIKDESNNFLKKALAKIETEILMDSNKGYWMDFSLVNPIKMKNGYLEVNSYALLYNENKPKTQKRNRIPLTYVPSISKVGNNYQIYISEYSINAALFTLFSTESISFRVGSGSINAQLLEIILPGIKQKYGNQKLELDFEVTKEGTLEFVPNKVIAKIYGQVIIKQEDTKEIIFQADSEVTAVVQFLIKEKLTITGKINSLTIKTSSIPVNKCATEVLIEKRLNSLFDVILPLANIFIENQIKFTLPIFFKNIDIIVNNRYITVNYALRKETFTFLNTRLMVNKFEDIYLETYTDRIKNALDLMYSPIDSFLKFYFPKNTTIINQFSKIYSIIKTLPDKMNDQNGLQTTFTQLENEISKINNFLTSKSFYVNNFYTQLKFFMERNIEFIKSNPPKDNQNVINNLKNMLREWGTKTICWLDSITFQLIIQETDYFSLLNPASIFDNCVMSYRK